MGQGQLLPVVVLRLSIEYPAVAVVSLVHRTLRYQQS